VYVAQGQGESTLAQKITGFKNFAILFQGRTYAGVKIFVCLDWFESKSGDLLSLEGVAAGFHIENGTRRAVFLLP
jgi:hypothetical protein